MKSALKLFLVLVALLTAAPAMAQLPKPAEAPSAKATPKPTPPKAAPRVPVVQAPRVPAAKKQPPKKPAAAKPETGAKAATAAAVAAAAAAAAAAATVVAPSAEPSPPAVDPNKGGVTGLPIPRFVALRFDDVNLRVGPGTRYPIDWVYHRRDLPVEILRELDDWRLVQDQDSVRGWVRAPTLTPRRGFVVRDAERTLRATAADTGNPVARLKPGVIGRVRSCAAGSIWCEVEVATYRGFLKRDEMFGVYPNEAIGG